MSALIYKSFLAEKAAFHSQKPVESAKPGYKRVRTLEGRHAPAQHSLLTVRL